MGQANKQTEQTNERTKKMLKLMKTINIMCAAIEYVVVISILVWLTLIHRRSLASGDKR